jgi:selenium-binding protein 1
MVQWKPDPTFYPSPRMAMQAPAETLAYVAAFNPNKNGQERKPDAMTVVDLGAGVPHLRHSSGESRHAETWR